VLRPSRPSRPSPGADGEPGTALSGHRWLLSPAALGRFLAALPAPMQLGKVEFDDGTWRTAFGCDASAPRCRHQRVRQLASGDRAGAVGYYARSRRCGLRWP